MIESRSCSKNSSLNMNELHLDITVESNHGRLHARLHARERHKGSQVRFVYSILPS